MTTEHTAARASQSSRESAEPEATSGKAEQTKADPSTEDAHSLTAAAAQASTAYRQIAETLDRDPSFTELDEQAPRLAELFRTADAGARDYLDMLTGALEATDTGQDL